MAEYRSGDGFDRARNTAYQRQWRGAISRARKAKAGRKKAKNMQGTPNAEYMARRNKAVAKKRRPTRQHNRPPSRTPTRQHNRPPSRT